MRAMFDRAGAAIGAAAVLLVGAAFGHQAAAESITVDHWGTSFHGVPYAMALRQGFFKKHGVDVTDILTSTGGGTSVRNTLAGDLPYGEVSLTAALDAIAAGQPLVIVCSGAGSTADLTWVVKPDSPISSIKDIVGKRVAYTAPGSVTNMVLLMMMKASGIRPDQVTLVAAGGLGANLAAVLSGAVDAGVIGEPTWSQERAKGTVKAAFQVRDIIPPAMTQTVGVVTRDFAKAHPETVRAIIAGRREGVDFIRQHTDEAVAITAEMWHLDPALTRRLFNGMFEIGYWTDGSFDYAAMDHMVEGLQIVGKLKGPMDWSKVVDARYLPDDLQAKSH